MTHSCSPGRPASCHRHGSCRGWCGTPTSIRPTGAIGAFTTLHRGRIGDARGSSQNGLTAEFLGDYNYAVATNSFGIAVWNDVRNAADCTAVDTWRQSITDGAPGPKPAPNSDCLPPFTNTFGNSDIYGGSYADPS